MSAFAAASGADWWARFVHFLAMSMLAMPATKARTPRLSRRLLPQRVAASASVVLGINMPSSATAAPPRPATA